MVNRGNLITIISDKAALPFGTICEVVSITYGKLRVVAGETEKRALIPKDFVRKL